MIKLTFEFLTLDDVMAFLDRQHLKPVKEVPGVVVPLPKAKRTAPRPEMAAENAAPAQPVPVSVAVPTTAAKPEAAPAPVKAALKVPNAPVQAVAKVDADAVRIALRAVFNDKGAAVATEILKQFGAARVSDIVPADYALFIKACAK